MGSWPSPFSIFLLSLFIISANQMEKLKRRPASSLEREKSQDDVWSSRRLRHFPIITRYHYKKKTIVIPENPGLGKFNRPHSWIKAYFLFENCLFAWGLLRSLKTNEKVWTWGLSSKSRIIITSFFFISGLLGTKRKPAVTNINAYETNNVNSIDK